MRVAFIVKNFPVITETFILNQITGLIDRGVDVHIYSFHQSEESIYHPVIDEYNLLQKTVYLNRVPSGFFQRVRHLIKLIVDKKNTNITRKVFQACNIFKYGRQAASLYLTAILYLLRNIPSYDILHCQFGVVAPQLLIFKEIGAIEGKLVTSFRGRDASVHLTHNHGFYKELFNKGDLFLPVCNYFRVNLIQRGCHQDKTQVLYSGIDITKLHTSDIQSQTPNGVTNIATIARLVEKKGVKYGILAMQKVLQAGRKLKYTIIGDGEMRERLQVLIRENNLENHVEIAGIKTQDEILTFLKNVHILLAPSVTTKDGDKEGIPNVLKEAMALGIPVVATDHSGIPELVKDGVSGFIVPERDVDGLAEKIMYLIDHPEVWPEFGKAGRSYIEKYFDIEKLNDRLVEHYARLIDSQ